MDTTTSAERRTVADVIQERMRELDVSLLALSERSAIPRVTLRRHLLRGGDGLSLAALESIAIALETTPADLLESTRVTRARAT